MENDTFEIFFFVFRHVHALKFILFCKSTFFFLFSLKMVLCVQAYHTDMKIGLLWKHIYSWPVVVLCTCRFIIIKVKGACSPELLHSYHFFHSRIVSC